MLSKKNKEYRAKNKDKRNQRDRERRKNDLNFKIKVNLRNRMCKVLKGTNKSASTEELLGCSTQEFKNYLKSLWQEGMSWDNYGNPNGDHSNCWHIDHILPCDSFDLTDPEQQKQCFHYTNLQPLWGLDNLKKSNKI